MSTPDHTLQITDTEDDTPDAQKTSEDGWVPVLGNPSTSCLLVRRSPTTWRRASEHRPRETSYLQQLNQKRLLFSAVLEQGHC